MQMGQGMMQPPPGHPMSPRGQWQRRAMNAIGRVRGISFPKWVTQYGMVVYIVALIIVSFMYSAYSLPWYYMLSGVVAVAAFFLYGKNLAVHTEISKNHTVKTFEKRIFLIAFLLRLSWMLLIYAIFMQIYGDAFGYIDADAKYYHALGEFVSGLIGKGNFHFYDEITKWCGSDDISDMGYGVYMGFVYWLTGNSIIVVRLLKCIWSALTVVMLYRLAKRNFGEQTGRLAAIFVALWPNFWYYCGAHLKEPEMLFLAVLFVEQADQMLRSRQFTAWKVMPVLLVAAAMFTFRTPLALVAILALLFTILMSSTRVVSWGKRILVGVCAVILIGITMGNRIQEQSRALIESVQTSGQDNNMEWRSRREHGNAFAKYAGTAVFAPMIFTIPFPTMAMAYDGQKTQMLLNGGNYIKNIMSYFTIMALFVLLLTGRWREHTLPLAFLLGYLVVLTFSSFPHSERFHQPVMPFEFMFAAYGISIAVTKPKYKRWFMYWCGLMFIAAIAWNWFKLAGRGGV